MRRGVVLGSLLAFVVVLPAAAGSYGASIQGEALLVPATANIFGAGRISPPAGPGGVGTRPPLYTLPKGRPRLLTFSSVTGEITCCKTGSNVFKGPAGRSDYATNLKGVPGVSGVKSRRSMFLAGVFLDQTRLTYVPETGTHTRAPELGQVFYIGNGQGGGGPVPFEVPSNATRLYLGIADGYNFQGVPGYYGDNAGSFAATFEVTPDTRRRDVRFSVLTKKELVASRRDPDLVDARLGGAGVIVDFDGAKSPRGAFSLTVAWLQEDDWHLVLRPSGNWFYNATRRSVAGYVEVVKSDAPACKKGFDWRFAVRQSAGRDAAAVQPRACRGLGELAWREPSSSIVVKITEVRR